MGEGSITGGQMPGWHIAGEQAEPLRPLARRLPVGAEEGWGWWPNPMAAGHSGNEGTFNMWLRLGLETNRHCIFNIFIYGS